jgi:hypothetical protein
MMARSIPAVRSPVVTHLRADNVLARRPLEAPTNGLGGSVNPGNAPARQIGTAPRPVGTTQPILNRLFVPIMPRKHEYLRPVGLNVGGFGCQSTSSGDVSKGGGGGPASSSVGHRYIGHLSNKISTMPTDRVGCASSQRNAPESVSGKKRGRSELSVSRPLPTVTCSTVSTAGALGLVEPVMPNFN